MNGPDIDCMSEVRGGPFNDVSNRRFSPFLTWQENPPFKCSVWTSPQTQHVSRPPQSSSEPNPRLHDPVRQMVVAIIEPFHSKSYYSRIPHLEHRSIISPPPSHAQGAMQHIQLSDSIPTPSASANAHLQPEL